MGNYGHRSSGSSYGQNRRGFSGKKFGGSKKKANPVTTRETPLDRSIEEKVLYLAEKEGSVNPNDSRISNDFTTAQGILDRLENKGLLKYEGDATYFLTKKGSVKADKRPNAYSIRVSDGYKEGTQYFATKEDALDAIAVHHLEVLDNGKVKKAKFPVGTTAKEIVWVDGNKPQKTFTVRVGRTKFKVEAETVEEANYIAGQTLGGNWSPKIKESWKMD